MLGASFLLKNREERGHVCSHRASR
jgi:hypothetical protein